MTFDKSKTVRGIGTLPKVLAFLYFAGACVLAWLFHVEESPIMSMLVFVVAALMLVVSCRIRVWIEDDAIHIRSYWRTRRYSRQSLDLVMVGEYGGWWTGGRPAQLIGWAQIDFFRCDSWQEDRVPATLCFTSVGRRAVEEINHWIDTGSS
ncbi:hypothetical protein [Microbacterium sp.]|uniref:hypothetical protein n=1 Tax=Microbacterium sp. TaxID=51671 RepID=UPI002810A320|nr:hypothetical protein [Microbacterium sp.]